MGVYDTRAWEILQLTKQIPFSITEATKSATATSLTSGTTVDPYDHWAKVTWAAAEALYDKYAAEEQKEFDAYQEPEK